MIEVRYEEQKYFHLFSEGTKEDVLFHNEEEFNVGMNIVAMAAYSTGMEILAFVLMDTHFHFVIHSSEEGAVAFVTKLMQMYQCRRLKQKPTHKMKTVKWTMSHLDTTKYLMIAIVYVLRNPIFSTHDILFNYQWSSANLYFNSKQRYSTLSSSYKKVEEFQVVAMRRLLGTKLKLPLSWLITSSNVIWPGNYINIKEVENLFRDANNFLYRVSYINREDLALLEQGNFRIGVTDLEARSIAKKYAKERFGTDEFGQISPLQKQILAKELYTKASVNVKQIKRILNVVFKV